MQNINQCIGTVVAYTAITATALKTENHVPLPELASKAVSMEKKTQNIALQLCISSKEPVQPKYHVKVWPGTNQNVPELKEQKCSFRKCGQQSYFTQIVLVKNENEYKKVVLKLH